jgi:hypothetical protein
MAIKANDVIYLPVTLATLAGVPVSFATKAALLAAGFAFGYRVSGAAVSSPTWSWNVINAATGEHEIALTVADGKADAVLRPPFGYRCNVASWILDVESNDLDAIASAVLSSSGTSIVTAGISTGRLDDWIQADDYAHTGLVVPLGALSKVGLSDLTGSPTLTCGAKQYWPTKNAADTEEIRFVVTVTDGANRVVKITSTWAAALSFNAGIVLATAEKRSYKVDLSVSNAGLKQTVGQYDLDLKWQADTQ